MLSTHLPIPNKLHKGEVWVCVIHHSIPRYCPGSWAELTRVLSGWKNCSQQLEVPLTDSPPLSPAFGDCLLLREEDWRRQAWQPTPVFFPGKSHGQRSLVGYGPLGWKESDTTKWLSMHGREQANLEDEDPVLSSPSGTAPVGHLTYRTPSGLD